MTLIRNGVSYIADRIVGNGSFGVVMQAVVAGTNEVVAIKKVLQDKRFKVYSPSDSAYLFSPPLLLHGPSRPLILLTPSLSFLPLLTYATEQGASDYENAQPL
jgi:hypothetical protein